MKNKLIASALLALSVAASGSAFAQRGEYGNDRNGRNDYAQRQDNNRYDNDRGDRGDRNDRYDHDRNDRGRNDGHRYGRNDRYDDARNFYRDDRRGGGPRHDLRRGQRLGYEYRDNRYVVNDWRARRLSAPPRGHHWVRAGDDYVLAAIATGLIAQVLLNNY